MQLSGRAPGSFALLLAWLVSTPVIAYIRREPSHRIRAAIAADGMTAPAMVEEQGTSSITVDTKVENYPMYVCNSICAQCANGEIIFVRRAMSWKHFAVRAGFEVTIGSLASVTKVTGIGTVTSYALTAASEALARRADIMQLPNECRAVSVLRVTNMTNSSGDLNISFAQLDRNAYDENPFLQIYMKNMNVIAQKELDAKKKGKLSWRRWAKRLAGIEQVYEKPGEVPNVVEQLTSHYFCGGDIGGLMQDENATEGEGVNQDGSANDSDTDSQNSQAVVDDIINMSGLNISSDGHEKVIEQESNWKAFRRSVSTVGGIAGKGRAQALKRCHAVADKVGLAPLPEEQQEDIQAATTFEKEILAKSNSSEDHQ